MKDESKTTKPTYGELLSAVEMAGRTFRTFQRMHLDKKPPDENKADRNRVYAEFYETLEERAKADDED